MTRIVVKRYRIEGDSWPIILAYLYGVPIYRETA